jgi:hypothetical protein
VSPAKNVLAGVSILIIVILVKFLWSRPNLVSAQVASPSPVPTPAQASFSASRALTDYLYTYDQYRSAHDDYQSARNEYLTYQTLVAQQKALDATKNMAKWRSELIRTYLVALRQRVTESTDIAMSDKQSLIDNLNTQANWANDQKSVVDSAGTLNDLVKLTQVLENRYDQINNAYYQGLTALLAGKEDSLRGKVQGQLDQLRTTVLALQTKGIKTEVYERWLLEAQGKIDRASDKQKEALGILSQMTGQSPGTYQGNNKPQGYLDIQNSFQQENIYLKEAVGFLQETLREAARSGV